MRVWLGIGLLCAGAWASGYLSLETNPSGVEVWYSTSGSNQMQYLGDSPLDSRELPAGTYNLWLINGKDTVNVPDVAVTDGEHTQVKHDMPANYGALKIHTDPDSGEIWLDGVKLGTSPYSNNLVLPGTYTLKLVPPSAMYRMREEKVNVHKGDSLNFERPFSFRDKSFLEENLSVRPFVVQVEEGYQYTSVFGTIDSSGKRHNFADSSKEKQSDFPLTLRMGFPFGLEAHFQLPFHTYSPSGLPAAPLPRDLAFGLKYTYRPLGIGLDASYSVGTSLANGGFNHNRLILTAIGDYAMNKILLQANGGYQFHFADNDSSDWVPGDVAFLNARVGYAADSFLPYLGVQGHFTLDGTQGDATVSGGYLVSLEPGLVFDDADLFSLQLGIPFAVLGQNDKEYWAIHFSAAVRFGFH